MKMTKQGVRDLGGNRRPPKEYDEFIVHRKFSVDVGPEGGHSGVTLEIAAETVRAAIAEARRLLRETYTGQEWVVREVRRRNRILWDDLNGYLR